MGSICSLRLAGLLLLLLPTVSLAAQQPSNAPLPDMRQLLREVMEHQKQLDKVRENYTYSSFQTVQDVEASGQVKKTETSESEDFFVNGHVIERTVKKNGQPLSGHDLDKETERQARSRDCWLPALWWTREEEKMHLPAAVAQPKDDLQLSTLLAWAEKTPPDQPLEGQTISISRILEIMDLRNPRREKFRGRPTIIFDFIGRRDAKTHGLAEDASKKLQGTIWVDESGRQVAHMEVIFNDNFKVGGGLLASIAKGSNFRFDQAPVNGEIWLPTGGEGTVQARILLLKNLRQHFVERDYDYKRFRVETEQLKDAKQVREKEK